MATAQVGWGRDTWNSGAWNTSPDALADVSGITVNTLLSSVSTSGNTLNNITGLQSNITLGQAQAGASVFFIPTGIQINISVGTVSTGEGRQITITTAGELQTDINFGVGWGRDTYSSGPWNEGLGGFVIGNGTIFIEDGQELTSSINSVSNVTGSVNQLIDSQLIQSNAGNVNILGNSIIDNVTGIQSNVSLSSVSIQAGGSITIATGPEIALDITLGNINVGTAMNFLATGVQININSGNVIANSENFILITGEEIITSEGNVVANSENFLSISGNQANVSVSTLKFWDPIRPTITETWTNIH